MTKFLRNLKKKIIKKKFSFGGENLAKSEFFIKFDGDIIWQRITILIKFGGDLIWRITFLQDPPIPPIFLSAKFSPPKVFFGKFLILWAEINIVQKGLWSLSAILSHDVIFKRRHNFLLFFVGFSSLRLFRS